MRMIRYIALLCFMLFAPLAVSHAQVSLGEGIGAPEYPVYQPAPVCEYGYYDYAPYACAPYGYYGPNYFTNGIFIGVGPWGYGGRWYRPYGYGYRGGYYRGYYGYHGGYGYGGFHGGYGFHGGFHGGHR